MSPGAHEPVLLVMPDEMKASFLRILLASGMHHDHAELCAAVFTDNSTDGVYTHGVNRFPRFVQYISDGLVQPNAVATLTGSNGSMEQWNGNSGPGPVNAMAATDRVVAMARQHGIACVTLANTNHWMRGGLYGWQAARQGCILIAWTNTVANMPTWGATNAKLGNNPLVIAMPHGNEALVLDMAMSQYSYGALEQYMSRGSLLPVAGGYDAAGEFTNDPGKILSSKRVLPVGYWKGAGMALLLDVLAAVLSGGQSTAMITRNGAETAVSQVFIGIDPTGLPHASSIPTLIQDILSDYKQSTPAHPTDTIGYPGERVMQTRAKNLEQGIPVDRALWQEILNLA